MSDETKDMSRRGFIGAGGAALLSGMVLGALPLEGKEGAGLAAGTLPKKWDEVYDVVVVGTGFAGLAAAIEARLAGASVLVIEKMPVYGGNSIINGGDFAAAGNTFQKEAGVQDSPELMLKDMLKAGSNLNHPALARLVAEQSNEALEWCRTYIGAKFTRLNFHGGHSVKRSVQTYNQSGSGLVNPLLDKAKSLGAKVVLRTKMTRLIAGKDGRIVGMEVRQGYKWPDEASGTPSFIKARRSVILAAGGFSQNVALRQIHDPRITSKFESTNHPGATGEAILAACSAGAMDVQMDWIQLGPWTSPDEPGFGHTPQVCERIVGYGLMVDPATGKRFFKETGNRKERADAIIAIGHPVIIVGDSYAIGKQVIPKTLEKAMAVGAVKRFDTLEEVAKSYKVPVQVFLEEVARWNGYVEKAKDPDFDCKIFPDSKPTATAPFYAMRLWPRVHHTMGGLVVNTQAQVIGFDMKPIKGLYAAGEITGGVHGAVRLGSVAMADCVVNGRIAGKNAQWREGVELKMHPTYLNERISNMSSPVLKRFATAVRLLLFAALIPPRLAATQAPTMTADLHKAKGVTCVDCHGKTGKKTFVAAERCLSCHGPATDLVKKTANVKPENPHDSPHWGPTMECNVCHRQHEKTVNWCNHCHAYPFKVR